MLPTFQTIVCAHGLGPHFLHILRHAESLAERYDGTVTVVHALEPVGSYAQNMLELYVPHELTEQMHAETRQKLLRSIEAQLESFQQQEEGGRSRVSGVRLRDGPPDEVILQEARDVGADVIVMGAHRHSTLGELLLGSTAHRVMQRAQIPVLLVRVNG